ncbi:MAG TPA: S8 family serine peptidase [Gemmatimonadaceae bacterium]|nr:S8 family serine peptidase [Gemmatimonadaceae bacterium]
MAKKNSGRSPRPRAGGGDGDGRASSSVDELLVAALERGDESLETGRYLVTFKETAAEEGVQSFGALGLRVADARDFEDQAATLENVGDADAVVFPEIGVALVGAGAAQERSMSANSEIASDSPVEAIEPEYFVFPQEAPGDLLRNAMTRAANGGTTTEPLRNGFTRTVSPDTAEYLRGFARAAQAIAGDLTEIDQAELETEEEALVLGATWGLIRCKVPPSLRSGAGIRVAVLDTGMDLGHPDFVGRPVVGATFVGQPVQDLHSHGTHCIGTACGPKAPAGSTPRYGIAYRAPIFVGKVLSNTGTGSTASVLAGMNWAIANRCVVISLSLGSRAPVQAAYTAAGNAALARGCLIVAAAGNDASPTGSPANSPSIMSVASLDPTLAPSSFSNFGKVEIAAPGRDVFSSVPRPTRYGIKSGTSMATPHVAGCAALWAETSTSLRGIALWRKLLATARRLPYPPARVGAGLVQAP